MCTSMSLVYMCISLWLGSEPATQPSLNLIGNMPMLYLFGYFSFLSVSLFVSLFIYLLFNTRSDLPCAERL